MTSRVDKHLVELHFSGSAGNYHDATPVQAAMAGELAQMLAARQPPAKVRRILELGCGTGHLTAKLCRSHPAADICAVDISPAMLDELRRRLGDNPRLRLLADDAEVLPDRLGREPGFDLIAASAAVHWFDDPPATVRRLLRLLRPGGMLAFATFGPDTFCELRQAFCAAEEALSLPPGEHLLPLAGADDWRQALADAGAVDLVEERQQRHYASVPTLLRQIKTAGSSMASPRQRPFVGKKLYARMQREYRQRHGCGDNGGILATYHMIYACCSARPPSATPGASPATGCLLPPGQSRRP